MSSSDPLLKGEPSCYSDEKDRISGNHHTSRYIWHCRDFHLWSWVAQLFMFSTSISLLAISFYPKCQEQRSCVEKHSTYSPALEVVRDEYQPWRFNGTLTHPSPYKGPPSLSNEKSWMRLIDVGAFSLPEEALSRIGAPTSSVRLPEESGGGYMAMLEMHHQIHCVNLLWKQTYHENDTSESTSSEGKKPSMLRAHIDHCADLLRQKLMCDADVGVITYHWVHHHKGPTPNFNTVHQCRNFEEILQWARNNEAPRPPSGEIERPVDAIVLEDFP